MRNEKMMSVFAKSFAPAAIITAVILPILCLSGCGSAVGYTEPEEIRVISAIGVDPAEKGVEVSLQAVSGGTGSTEVLSAEGESLTVTLFHLIGEGEKKNELSHCALIALGDGLSTDMIDELIGLCRESYDLPDTVLFVSTQNAFELLNLDGAAGYDLAGTMRSEPHRPGLFSRNRLYEIAMGEDDEMALPYFYVADGEYELFGLKLYRDRGELVLLDRDESGVYLMLRGIFTEGLVKYGDKGRETVAAIEKSVTRVREKDGGIEIKCIITVQTELDINGKSALAEWLGSKAEELYASLTARYGLDLGYAMEIKNIIFEVSGR